MQWSTARTDWRERIVARESLLPDGMPLFPGRAAEALAVFKSLQMTDLPMKRDGTWPTMGEACEPFVFDLVAAMFGSQDPEAGNSLIKEALLLISKKNGKSTIAAGIMLTALILNWRDSGELLILAPTIEIANNSFLPAAAMVRADPRLDAARGEGGVLKVTDTNRTIKHLTKNAILKVVAADRDVVSGKKAGFVLVDELWLFGKKPGADGMLEEATGGQAARPEGFTLYLTTHSDEAPAGVFKSKLAYARDVRDGKIDDPTFLPMLYEWPEEMIEADEYLDPDKYYVTNPNIGKSPTVEFIKRKIDQVKAGEGSDGDTTLQIVLAKYLNVEIGLRLSRDRWRGADLWLRAATPGLSLEALLERCEVVVCGIDGGGLDDLFGFSAVGREKGTGNWLAVQLAWCMREVLELRKDIAPRLLDFQSAGTLTLCDSATQDIEEVAELVAQVNASGLLPEKGAVGLDPLAVGALVDALIAKKLTEEQLVAIGQGFRLSSAVWSAERKLRDGTLLHDGSDMMAWCVGNAKAEQRGNAVYITKETAGKAKIDPLVAFFNAVKLMERNPVAVVKAPPMVFALD